MFFKTRKMVKAALTILEDYKIATAQILGRLDSIDQRLGEEDLKILEENAKVICPVGANGMVKLDFFDSSVAIVGGPYRKKPKFMAGVKLASEIDAAFDVELAIEDFSVPDTKDTVIALYEAYLLLAQHQVIYVGCMGGIGRTGMFIALMMKVHAYMIGLDIDPVQEVRLAYLAHSVETTEQANFVWEFDVTEIALRLRECGLFNCN